MDQPTVDYYETLQISPNAEPETLHRVYRLLAMRLHPDNGETGSETRFRELTEAYQVLSDPERRAQYDALHQQLTRDRWRVMEKAVEAENDFIAEQFVRLAVLEVLYTQRRVDPYRPGLHVVDLEKMTGRPREHLEFTVWFLVQKKYVQRGDNSALVITADGVEHLEQNYTPNGKNKRLRARNE